MPKFRVSRTQHQYGFRWAVLETPASEPGFSREISRCSCLADASLICDALNKAAKDETGWNKMLGKAGQAFTKYEQRRERRASAA